MVRKNNTKIKEDEPVTASMTSEEEATTPAEEVPGAPEEPIEEAVDEIAEVPEEPIEEEVPFDPDAPVLDLPEAPELAPAPEVTEAPTFEAPKIPKAPEVTEAPTIPGMTVTPAPEYEKTPEQEAWEEMYSGKIRETIQKKGEGIPEETQRLMLRKATLMLQSRETESLRSMADDMERRGITDSGQVFERTQQIKATTTRAIAASVTDVQIKSSLMKMESFERAMGHAASYLSYLGDQSKMAFGSKMATWHAQTQVDMTQYQAQINVSLEQWKMENQFNLVEWQARKEALFAQWQANANATMTKWTMENQFAMEEWKTQAQYDLSIHQLDTQVAMAQWQAEYDVYKMGIDQAYQQDNMLLAADIAAIVAEDQQDHDIELAGMELEHDKKKAAASGFGNILGLILGGIFSLISPTG